MLCANNPALPTDQPLCGCWREGCLVSILNKLPMGQSRCGRGETKTYGLVFSLHVVDRVGSFYSPTLPCQQTNRYAVVSERALDVLCTGIIYTARGGFSYIVKHSCTSGGHLLCIGIAFLMHHEVIYHILNSYLPPIGNVMRKQPQRGWSVGRAGLASETSLPCLSGTHP